MEFVAGAAKQGPNLSMKQLGLRLREERPTGHRGGAELTLSVHHCWKYARRDALAV